MIRIAPPEDLLRVLRRLTEAGYPAYCVGGCIRDSLRGVAPADWDVATAALPEEVHRVFRDMRVIDTGEKHGTVTLLTGERSVEITTFRRESGYSDRRRPDLVTFITDPTQDLARRDFTVNAMAWAPEAGLLDPFGGQQDLEKKILRCVGDPTARFNEDALRIMRGLRFAATLRLTVEPATDAAIRCCRDLLREIARERITAELVRLLEGAEAGAMLREYPEVFAVFAPELRAERWRWVQKAPAHRITRLAILLDDPSPLLRLRFSRQDIRLTEQLIRYKHEPDIACPALLKRILGDLGREQTLRLLDLLEAGGNSLARERKIWVDRWIRDGVCLSLKDLSVKGSDLTNVGIPGGKAVGSILDRLLQEVLEEKLPNERDALLLRAEELKKEVES